MELVYFVFVGGTLNIMYIMYLPGLTLALVPYIICII